MECTTRTSIYALGRYCEQSVFCVLTPALTLARLSFAFEVMAAPLDTLHSQPSECCSVLTVAGFIRRWDSNCVSWFLSERWVTSDLVERLENFRRSRVRGRGVGFIVHVKWELLIGVEIPTAFSRFISKLSGFASSLKVGKQARKFQA